jgi:hypothetical protein
VAYLLGGHHQSRETGLVGDIQVNTSVNHSLQQREVARADREVRSGPAVDVNGIDALLGVQGTVNAVDVTVDHGLEQKAISGRLRSALLRRDENGIRASNAQNNKDKKNCTHLGDCCLISILSWSVARSSKSSVRAFKAAFIIQRFRGQKHVLIGVMTLAIDVPFLSLRCCRLLCW